MQGTFSLILNFVCFVLVGSFISISSVVYGQDDQSEAIEKQTIEPVFRVPKIASSDLDAADASSNTDSAAVQSPKNVAKSVTQSDVDSNQPVAQAPPLRTADASTINPSLDNKSVSLVPKLNLATAVAPHPLDRAVELAKNGLKNMHDNIADYTAIMVKRECVGNQLGEPNYMKIKIRNSRQSKGQTTPLSIYMKFIKPRAAAGREVIWVQGQNGNKLIAHETSPLLKFRNFHLDPDGMLAMRGNRYPIYDAGLENLIYKLIEKAERDRKAGNCEVRYLDGARINKRPCTVIEVVHNQKRNPYEFHIAKVYIDDELQIPVRFVSYDWPLPGAKPKIIEEYTYINVKTNVGLSDFDFDISNPAYSFAR